ncbi:response regulator [Marinicella sp. W31]|uniref:hybrid sensor histidine kinase/response regulator transcription factor n=1 Tax=Marinicella sp. W31 TaxID=3023713 RepID=UPI0037567D85
MGVLKLLSLSYLLLSWCFCAAQTSETNYAITHYDHQDGLPQITIRDIKQDAKGFIWIGTENGLVRFDGVRFKKIKAPTGRTVVSELQIDRNEKIWVRWIGHWSDIYDPKQNQWQTIEKSKDSMYEGFYDDGERFWLKQRKPSKLTYLDNDYVIHHLHEPNIQAMFGNSTSKIEKIKYFQDEKRIWLANKKQISLINLANNRHISLSFSKEIFVLNLFFYHDWVYLCSQQGVRRFKLDGSSNSEIFWSEDGIGQPCFRSGNKLIQPFIKAKNHSVFFVDMSSGNYQAKFNNKDSKALQKTNEITLKSFDNKLWFITEHGLYEIQGNKVIDHFHVSNYEINTTASTVTDEGVLWIGTENKGIFKVSNQSAKFKTLRTETLPNNHFRKAVMTGNDIWFGLNAGGVAKYNRTTKMWKHYALSEIEFNQTRAITSDNKGNVYAGMASGLLVKFDTKNDRFEIMHQVNAGSQINTLLYSEPYLWVGSSQNILRYNTEGDEFFDASVEDFPIYGHQVKAMALSNDGNLLIGSHLGGISKVSQSGKTLKTWKQIEPYSEYVFSVYQDELGFIWGGTWGAGLVRIHPNTGELQFFNEDNGLNDNTVFGILPGRKGELWISTYNGLTQFNNCITNQWPCNPQTRHFSQHDGLQGKEFDAEAFALLDSGELYFGGSGGANIFYPADLPFNRHRPHMVISGIKVDNQELDVIDSKQVEIPHDYKQLSIDFASIDFHAPEVNQYQYRTSSSDKWIDLQQPNLELAQLQSGLHTFEIRGSNNDGFWAKDPLLFRVKVKPPLYLSPISYAIYALIFTFLIFSWMKWRIWNIRQRNVLLEKQVKNRTQKLEKANNQINRLFSSVSHRTKTPLACIMLNIEAFREGHTMKSDWLDTIYRQSQELKHYIDDLMNLSRLDEEVDIALGAHEIGAYLPTLVSDMKLLANAKNISLSYSNHLPPHTAVQSYKRSLNIIMNNLLENALKQTHEGGNITIESSMSNGQVLISVTDNGPGIPEDMEKHIFDFGHTNNKKLAWLDSSGIGLFVSRTTARKLGGDLRLKKLKKPGACFELTLPLATPQLHSIEDFSNNPLPKMQNQLDSKEDNIRGSDDSLPVVLIVEDNLALQETMKNFLSMEYKIIKASNGQEGFEKMKKYGPDLVICDVMMPQKNGFEFLQDARQEITTETIPVIILTAMEEHKAKIMGYGYQADCVLTKPMDITELKLIIRNLIQRRQIIELRSYLEFESLKVQVNEYPSNENHFYIKIMDVLSNNYHDKNFNVERLSKKMGLGSKALNQRLKKYSSVRALDMIHYFRINKAKRMLRQGNKVIDVAMSCGYDSSQVFAKKFKTVVGIKPSEYQ